MRWLLPLLGLVTLFAVARGDAQSTRTSCVSPLLERDSVDPARGATPVVDNWRAARVFRGTWSFDEARSNVTRARALELLGMPASTGARGYFAFSVSSALELPGVARVTKRASSATATVPQVDPPRVASVLGDAVFRPDAFVDSPTSMLTFNGLLWRDDAVLALAAEPTQDGERACLPANLWNATAAAAPDARASWAWGLGRAPSGSSPATLCVFSIAFTAVASANPRPSAWKRQADIHGTPSQYGDVADVDVWTLVGTARSPNCAIELAVQVASVPDELGVRKALGFSILCSLVALALVYAQVDQMAATDTDSAAARVSVVLVAGLAISDCHAAMALLAYGSMSPVVFPAFAVAALGQFVLFTVFESQYLVIVWRASRLQAFTSGMAALRRTLLVLYVRFYFALAVAIVLFYLFDARATGMLFALSSYWVPQILCNVHRDTAGALTWRFVAINTFARLAVPMYTQVCPDNLFRLKPRPLPFAMVVAFSLAQVAVLASQDRWGPRWFIPRRLLPRKYSYTEAAAVAAQAFVAGDGSEPVCTVCLSAVGGAGDDGSMGRAMRTPCEHTFHSDCLLPWLEMRLECPTCRAPLPPP